MGNLSKNSNGQWNVTPAKKDIKIKTSGTYIHDDILVKAVDVDAVKNLYGESTCTVAGGELSKGTASGGGLSGGGLSGGGLTAGSGQCVYSSSVNVAMSVTEDTGISITFRGSGTVNRAEIKRDKIDRAAFSQRVTRADITDAHTAGYMPTKSAETAISSTYTDVSLAAGSIAADSIAADSLTSNTAYGTAYVKYIVVPKDKTFTLKTAEDTALDTTSTTTIINNAYRQLAITNNENGDVDVTTTGKTDVTANSATTGTVTVNAYNNASTPSLTGAKTIVTNGKWNRTSLNATSSSGTYYGAIDFTKPTTQAATTYNTSTSDQTIASGTYLSGTQTIKAVTTSNIDAGNIKKDVVVKVGDANNAGRIKNVTGTLDYIKTVTSVPTTKDTSIIYNSTNKTYYLWRS